MLGDPCERKPISLYRHLVAFYTIPTHAKNIPVSTLGGKEKDWVRVLDK